ncbi:MAG: hypothetical protein R3330_18740, partial [Saprospiraceae bacterium]|nr:hypothetical protein [Saprospiraceae bacterium]
MVLNVSGFGSHIQQGMLSFVKDDVAVCSPFFHGETTSQRVAESIKRLPHGAVGRYDQPIAIDPLVYFRNHGLGREEDLTILKMDLVGRSLDVDPRVLLQV